MQLSWANASGIAASNAYLSRFRSAPINRSSHRIECRRRKIRCDKKVPCKPCIRYGLAKSCAVPPTCLTTQATKSKDEIRFLRDLMPIIKQIRNNDSQRDIIAELVHQRLNILKTGTTNAGSLLETLETPYSSGDTPEDDRVATATTLLNLESGLREAQSDSPTFEVTSNGTTNANQRFSEALPKPEVARHLKRYHMDHLCWNHNVVHTSVFLDECEVYWQSGNMEHPLWITLYLAVLCVSTTKA